MAIHKIGQLSTEMQLSSVFPVQYKREFQHVSELSVTQDSVRLWDSNGQLDERVFSCVGEALLYLNPFTGTIRFYEDVTENVDLNKTFPSGTDSDVVLVNGGDILFDLNGHEWKMDFGGNSDVNKYAFYVQGGGKVVFINGTADFREVAPIRVVNGIVQLSSDSLVKCNQMIDCCKQQNVAGQCIFHICKGGEARWYENPNWDIFTGKSTGQYASGVWVFSSINLSSYQRYDQYTSAYDFAKGEKEHLPTLRIDGKFTYVGNQDVPFDGIQTSGNQDRAPTRIVVGKTGEIRSGSGIAIMSNTCGGVELEGGYIQGGSGVVLRAGYFEVEEDAWPTVIATKNVSENYNNGLSAGSGTSGLNIGHAVMAESRGGTYGKIVYYNRLYVKPRFSIKSGIYLSKDNVPIASYEHKESHKSNIGRVTNFVYGGELSMIPTSNQYQISSIGTQYNHPINVDNGIIADGYRAIPITEIHKQT